MIGSTNNWGSRFAWTCRSRWLHRILRVQIQRCSRLPVAIDLDSSHSAMRSWNFNDGWEEKKNYNERQIIKTRSMLKWQRLGGSACYFTIAIWWGKSWVLTWQKWNEITSQETLVEDIFDLLELTTDRKRWDMDRFSAFSAFLGLIQRSSDKYGWSFTKGWIIEMAPKAPFIWRYPDFSGYFIMCRM